MAYESASDWLGALDRTFSSAAQPLIAYNLERRRMAEQNRQYAHEELMIDKHAQAYAKELDAQQERRTKAEQKIQRDNALAEARGMGIGKDQLPDDSSYSDILVAVGKSRGKRLIASAKSAAAAVKAYADYRGETVRDVTKRVTDRAISPDRISPKELKDARLTQSDLNQISSDPDAINGLIAKAIREKNDKGAELLRRIKGDISSNLQSEIDLAEKSNPRLTGLAENFRLAHDAYINLEKQGGYDEASGIEASEALIKDTFPQQQQQKSPVASPFTPPPRKASVTTASPDESMGGIESALRSITAPSRGGNAALNVLGEMISGGPGADPSYSVPPRSYGNPPSMWPAGGSPRVFRTPAAPPAINPISVGSVNPGQPGLTSGTSVPVDPSVLATLRLQSAIQDAGNGQIALTPIAYPPFKPVVPAPDETGVAIPPWLPVR